MRLPGTRYQEHGWEHVRKLLGRCSLQAFARDALTQLLDPAQDEAQLALYTDLMADMLRAEARASRFAASGNSYGESVADLASSLLVELRARPADWIAFCAALRTEHARSGAFWREAGGEALLRKKVNDMYAVLRDKVDADNYQAACGRPCSPNRMYTYRMLDTAYGEIERVFARWSELRAQAGAILGREIEAMPIEVRQMKSAAHCKAEWIIRWSETLERFGDGPGPLHTRSKRFASLKNSPDKIAAMLAEIGDYEELSANRDQAWLHDAGDALAWLDDLQRVLEQNPGPGPDQILDAPDDDCADAGPTPVAEDADDPREVQAATALSLPPRFMQLARAAQDGSSRTAHLLREESLPVRLAVYLKVLGGADDSYPSEWLDPATGELPTMAQLAALDDLSLPTLRKRRDAAIAKLSGAGAP